MSAAPFDEPSPAELARWAALPRGAIAIERAWDGSAVRADGAQLTLCFGQRELQVEIEAPYHGDALPALPPGSCPGLWEHEVVELFLLGSAERYLELEFGPHGHYLLLRLAGVRQVQAAGLPLLAYAASIDGPRWSASARVPLAYLPPGWSRYNAYAIDGEGPRRRHWAHFPVPGPSPDFHRLQYFGPYPGLVPT